MTIALLTTGGTIVSEPGPDGLRPGRDDSKLTRIAEEAGHEVHIEPVFSLDSTNVGPRQWEELATTCRRLASEYQGLVVVHGTDTMAYTAAALHFLLPDLDRPLVLTGSQIPLADPESDGPDNLKNALAVAASGRPGCFLVFGGRVLFADDARKVETKGNDAFQNQLRDQAGWVEEGKLHWLSEQAKRVPGRPLEARVDSRVLLVKLVPGFDPDWLRSLAHSDIQAFVLEGFGLGGIPGEASGFNLLPAIRELVQKGRLVVVSTQVARGGSELATYEVGRLAAQAGALEVPHLIPEVIAVKLMVGLAATSDRAGLQNYLLDPQPSRP